MRGNGVRGTCTCEGPIQVHSPGSKGGITGGICLAYHSQTSHHPYSPDSPPPVLQGGSLAFSSVVHSLYLWGLARAS